jgi:hypothetical protein
MNKNLLRQVLGKALKLLPKHGEYKSYIHYSFGVVDGSIYVIGQNKSATPDVHFGYGQRVPDPKIHSELDAYYKLRKQVSIKNAYWELINVRLNRSGEMKNSRPCEVCETWLTAIGCSRVTYTTESGWETLNLKT